MDQKMLDIGARIKEMRKKEGLTQKELGKAIGRTESLISAYEKGKVDIPSNTMEKLATILVNGDTNYLLTGQRAGAKRMQEAADRLATAIEDYKQVRLELQSVIAQEHNMTEEQLILLVDQYKAFLDANKITHHDFMSIIQDLASNDNSADRPILNIDFGNK